MLKYSFFVICLLVSSLVLSGCQTKTAKSPIKYERKLEKYLPKDSSQTGVIDLREGPQTRYEAKFGPKDLNFDIKINNPY